MPVNRGYVPAQQVIMDDWYDPNLEMLAQVGAVGQGKIDEASALLAKIGETQFQHLKGDTKYAEGIYKDIYANIDRLAKGAMGDGDIRSVRREIDQYARDVQRRFRPEGDIGAMVSNYNAFQKWNEELGKLTSKEFGKDGILSKHAEALRKAVLSQYEQQKGIGEKNPITGYQQINLIDPALSIDENKLVEEYGKGYIADSIENAAVDPTTGQLKQGAMWYDNGKIWRKTSKSVEQVDENAVFKDLVSSLVNHEGYAQYLNQLKSLGLSNHGATDIYVKDENGEVLIDQNGQAMLDKSHPIVAASLRGASKFGFKKIKYDDDIQFDQWDLKTYEHQLRMKEEQMKGDMMFFQTTAVQRDLKPEEITAAANTRKQTLDVIEMTIKKTQDRLSKLDKDSDEARSLQSQLNGYIQERNQHKVAINQANATLEKLAGLGGFNVKEQYEKNKAWFPDLSFEDFKGILAGTRPRPQMVQQVGPDKVAPADGQYILDGLITAARNAQTEGSKIGLVDTRDVILASDDSQLGKRMKLIEEYVAAGSLNFVGENGISFNNKEFAKQLATSKDAKIVPLVNGIGGMPGFQLTYKDNKGKLTTVTGTIPGLENSTFMKDIEIHLRDRLPYEEGISKEKAQQYGKVANMMAGQAMKPTDVKGNPTGVPSIATQMLDVSPESLRQGELSAPFHLPRGMEMELLAAGDGTYRPVFYRQSPGMMGGRIPIRPDDVGVPDGNMSISDLYEWLGKTMAPQAEENLQRRVK